jgi:sensor histidine kinase YesM
MAVSMMLGKKADRLDSNEDRMKVPLTTEIVIFYSATFFYNLCSVFNRIFEGDVSTPAVIGQRISMFCYFLAGAFQTLFFLQLLKDQVAERIGSKPLKYAILGVQLLHVICLFLLLITPFTNVLYRFDEQNIYRRGPLFFVWNAATIIAFIFIVAVTVAYREKMEKLLIQIVSVATVIPLISFALNTFYTEINFNTLSASITALIIFILYQKERTKIYVQNARELERAQTQLAESRLLLEESKNRTLMAQIQPHFINNSLMAIRSQCYDYPEIYESITDFSRYLRSNFEALGDTRLILFEQEMENIEAYLSLERRNFQDRLNVEYDIECDDFLIPALSVQPLVENAVRHGIGTYEKGGTVWIKSKRCGDMIVIEVIDDGSGKSHITPQQENRKGIGIDNVRKRLQSQNLGELEIITGEHGTTARITVKDNGGNE